MAIWGERVARRWHVAGEEVTVVTRSEGKAARLHNLGYRTIVADLGSPNTLAPLPPAETVLYAVGFDRPKTRLPPTPHHETSLQETYLTGLKNLLTALPKSTRRLIHISTTGVYGPADGRWVDESSPTHPQRETARAALAAEELLAASPLANRTVVLRLAGLYGPGRVPYIKRLQAGEPLAVPQEGWLNLIHVDDAAIAVLAADRWEAPPSGPHTFCVCDGHPVIRRDYYQEVARQLGVPAPGFAPPPFDSPTTARAASDKRVRNDKLLNSLRIELTYSTYHEGLEAIVRTDANDMTSG